MKDFTGTTENKKKETVKRTPDPLDVSLMDFKTFISKGKKSQN